MHPCCWPAMLQSILQAIPFLAIFAVGLKKAWGLLPKANKPNATTQEAASPCCSTMNACHEPDKKRVEIPITRIN